MTTDPDFSGCRTPEDRYWVARNWCFYGQRGRITEVSFQAVCTIAGIEPSQVKHLWPSSGRIYLTYSDDI